MPTLSNKPDNKPTESISGQRSLLRLLQLCSPNLPVGGYSYSQGIEWAVECGWITDAENTGLWIEELVCGPMQFQELPLLLKLYDAFDSDDVEAIRYWSEFSLACRETRELREEEMNRGRALELLLVQMPDIETENRQVRAALQRTQLAGLALAASQWKIPRADLAAGFSFSWVESLVYASLKLVPLGQTEAQKILHKLEVSIEKSVAEALTTENDFPVYSSPAVAIASSKHERQYSRLFRS